MEHSDLVAEMAHIERQTTQERLMMAKKRRIQQLKIYDQREKEWLRGRASTNTGGRKGVNISKMINSDKPKSKRNIYFNDNIILLEAAARNDIEEVRNLLSRGVSPEATNEDGLTALHQSCIDNNEEMLRLLLEKGANVNAEDTERWTPLHAAATCGNLQLVRILIQHGANLLAVNADGNMPYDICEDEASLDCIEGEMAARGITQRLIDSTRGSTERKMLRDLKNIAANNGELEYRDHQGATPLHIAAANGYLKVVEFLLDNHVSTDVRDHDLWQPVHAAACWGHMEVLETLVHNGADLNAKNKHDETPADICEDPEMRARIAQLVTEREARAKVSNGSGAGGRRGTGGARPSSSRAHSVRRTSLRERGLNAKHDAHEEAKMLQTFTGTVPQNTGLPNGTENQNSTKHITNGPTPSSKWSNSNQSTNHSTHNGDAQSQISTDRDSQTSSSQLPRITNPLYGVNAAAQYTPTSGGSANSNTVNFPNVHGNFKQNTSGSNQNNTSIQSFKNQGGSQFVTSTPSYNDTRVSESENALVPLNGVRKAPEGQDNESFVHEDIVDSSKELIVSASHLGIQSDTSSATHYSTDNNGKINLHVTVLINAGTLADLKKQRAQIRNSSPTESSLISPNTPLEPPTAPAVVNSNPPLSDVPRFSGNTGDVVGDSRTHRCCVIM